MIKYQVNYSQNTNVIMLSKPWNIYKDLIKFPAPYSTYFNFNEIILLVLLLKGLFIVEMELSKTN